jgi:integrase/recombinase XerD
LGSLPLAAADSHARAWITLQSHRGLAYNTLDAYSRGLERYFRFLTQFHFSCVSVTRAEVGLYLASLQADGSRLSNATMQQLLTVIRLFHAYPMEEGVRVNNPAAHSHTGGPLIARHHQLPRIPNEDDWHAILAAASHEPVRNRVMLAFAYDAGLRREELCSLRSDDIDPSRRTLRIRAETTKGRRERVVPYSASSSDLLHHYLLHRRTLGQRRDLSSFQSRVATTHSRSPSGAGRRWSWNSRDARMSSGSARIHCGTSVRPTLHVQVGTSTRSLHSPVIAAFRPHCSIST